MNPSSRFLPTLSHSCKCYSSRGKGVQVFGSQVIATLLVWWGVVSWQDIAVLLLSYELLQLSVLLREFLCRNVTVLFLLPGEKVLTSLAHQTLVEEVCHPIFTQQIYLEGKIQKSSCLCQGSKGSFKLNRYKAYIGFLRARVLQGEYFSEQEMVRFQTLNLDNFRDRLYFMLKHWLVSCSGNGWFLC